MIEGKLELLDCKRGVQGNLLGIKDIPTLRINFKIWE